MKLLKKSYSVSFRKQNHKIQLELRLINIEHGSNNRKATYIVIRHIGRDGLIVTSNANFFIILHDMFSWFFRKESYDKIALGIWLKCGRYNAITS